MKCFKYVLALVLAAVLLCGCGAELQTEELSGVWIGSGLYSRSDTAELLDRIELYDEEREFVDLDSLSYQKCVEFTEDGEYTFTWDAETNYAYVRSFYQGVMESLYTNRSDLSEIYGTDFDSMTREAFNQFYTELYGFSDYETMLDSFAAAAFDYTGMSEMKVTGEYKIDGSILVFIPDGEGEAEEKTVGWELENGHLTLTYANSKEVYTKAD